jgi:hypothetical protein
VVAADRFTKPADSSVYPRRAAHRPAAIAVGHLEFFDAWRQVCPRAERTEEPGGTRPDDRQCGGLERTDHRRLARSARTRSRVQRREHRSAQCFVHVDVSLQGRREDARRRRPAHGRHGRTARSQRCIGDADRREASSQTGRSRRDRLRRPCLGSVRTDRFQRRSPGSRATSTRRFRRSARRSQFHRTGSGPTGSSSSFLRSDVCPAPAQSRKGLSTSRCWRSSRDRPASRQRSHVRRRSGVPGTERRFSSSAPRRVRGSHRILPVPCAAW